MQTIIDRLLTPGSAYGRPGTTLAAKGVTVHYVGNPGSTAEANRGWFENGAGGALTSAHYIIGLNGEILRCVPESERAMHAGKSYGSQWNEAAKTNNSRYIGIECCHPDAAGKFNEKTYASLVALVADICLRHGFDPRKDVVRHYDITGKSCPMYYVYNPAAWKQLVEDVAIIAEAARAGKASTVNRNDSGPVSAGIATPTLRKGDKGEAVANMQALLNAVIIGTGLAPLDVDGSFGPATELLVKAFQASEGLANDGVCGPKTWAELLRYQKRLESEAEESTVSVTTTATAKSPVDVTVDNLVADIGASDRAYWTAGLNGDHPLSAVLVKEALDRYHNKLVEQ